MSELIVVERSASLCHLLTRTLQAADLSGWRELASTVDALAHIKREVGLGTPPRALLIGAPARLQLEFRALLEELSRNPQIAVLVLGHERLPELDLWLESHPAAEFLPWAQFGRVPAMLQQLAPANAALEPAPLRRSDAVRVLFVDDSASVRMKYQSVLLREGYAVDLAGTRHEALSRARARRYDLIVVDYYLPDGTGETLCRELREIAHTRDALIAVITGSYRDDIIHSCLEAGAIECMFKSEAMELFTVRIASLARQVQMQQRVESERQRLDGILGAVADGVYGVDRNGVVTFINPNGLRLLGYSHEDQVVGHAAHESFHPMREDGTLLAGEDSPLARAYSTSAPVNQFETVFWARDGAALPVECSLRPLAIDGRHQGAVVVFRDISDRKSVERLHWEMTHDGLTRLINTRHFRQLLGMELARRREIGGYAALLYIDVDRYQQILDGSGVNAAENLLIDLARRFGTLLRDGDVLARLERDRFGLLMPGVAPENLFALAESFRAQAQACAIEVNGAERPATVSVGVGLV
ncbi:MAG: diguanylate cyclase, partial [Lysobacterales bacterium]